MSNPGQPIQNPGVMLQPPPPPPPPAAPVQPAAAPQQPYVPIDPQTLTLIMQQASAQTLAQFRAELDARGLSPAKPPAPPPVDPATMTLAQQLEHERAERKKSEATTQELLARFSKMDADAHQANINTEAGKLLAGRVAPDLQPLFLSTFAKDIVNENGQLGKRGTIKGPGGIDLPNQFIPLKTVIEMELANRPSIDLSKITTIKLGDPLPPGITPSASGNPAGNYDHLVAADLRGNQALADHIYKKDPEQYAKIMQRIRPR